VVTNLCVLYDLPIFFQTLSPEFFAEISEKVAKLGRFGGLDYSNYEDVALSMLVFQVIQFVESQPSDFPMPMRGWIDAGRMKADNRVVVASSDKLVGGELTFVDSRDSLFIQLADFAAFSIGKAQWLLATKSSAKDWELEFISLISRLNTPNIAKVLVAKQTIGPDAFNTILELDRKNKGLGPMPKEKE
jgi:hypothetical protein